MLSAEQVQEMLKEYPALYAALVARAARTISQRLAATDATLVGHGRMLGFTGSRTRREHDLLGERDVPDDALYGIQTLRALENFPITGIPLREFPALVEALAAVKEAAALANADLGLLDRGVADLIVRAAQEIRAGRHHEHFLVDMIQGGAGTSTNMNANEVIANRALELMGRQRGDYAGVHPNNHVNLSQSTNDVYPTAVKLALHRAIDELRDGRERARAAFLAKGEEFAQLIKMGRTQLQDAVPMTLGQEFRAFGHTILEDVERLSEAQQLIREINMGATAIGTGINAPRGYSDTVREHLSRITKQRLITAPDLVEATMDTGVFVQLSGVLKRCAVKLSKICDDLRLLSSGPRAGLGEINLPAMSAHQKQSSASALAILHPPLIQMGTRTSGPARPPAKPVAPPGSGRRHTGSAGGTRSPGAARAGTASRPSLAHTPGVRRGDPPPPRPARPTIRNRTK